MKCPSCNQTASSFLRNAFSFQGVSFFQSIKGHLKCQNCGTLLHVHSFSRTFWYFSAATAIVLALFVLLYQQIFSVIGSDAITAIWIILMLLIIFLFTFGMWKYSILEIVEKGTKSTADVST